MKTTKALAVFLMTASLLATSQAFAGREGGNGGGAIVCGNTDGSIASAELLDLWETRTPDDGRTITRTGVPAEIQLENALRKLEAFDPRLVEQMRAVLKNLKTSPVDDDQQIVPPSDTGLRRIRKQRNCSLQGAADFDDTTGILTIDPEIREAMSPTDRAASDFHEALYKVWRGAPVYAQDSLRVRNLTRAVFADQPLGAISPTAGLAGATYECDAGGKFHFFVIPRTDGNVAFQFTRIAGRTVLDQTIAIPQKDPSKSCYALEMNPKGQEQLESLINRALGGFEKRLIPMRERDLPKNIGAYDSFADLCTTSQYEPGYGIRMAGDDRMKYTHGDHGFFEYNLFPGIKAAVPYGVDSGVSSETTCKKIR